MNTETESRMSPEHVRARFAVQSEVDRIMQATGLSHSEAVQALIDADGGLLASKLEGPFSLHEIWNEDRRHFEWAIRHGETPQSRYTYFFHGQKVLRLWNARAAIAQEPKP